MAEDSVYEIKAEGRYSEVVGDDMLLYMLERYAGQPVVVSKEDTRDVIPHFIEERAIQAAVADRETGEVVING